MVGYVNSQGVNNAKLLNLESDIGTTLIHSHDNDIILTKLTGSTGYLLCQTGDIEETYNFSILGQAKNCKARARNIGDCYYDKKSLSKLSRKTL